jgi:hypothetical protein
LKHRFSDVENRYRKTSSPFTESGGEKKSYIPWGVVYSLSKESAKREGRNSADNPENEHKLEGRGGGGGDSRAKRRKYLRGDEHGRCDGQGMHELESLDASAFLCFSTVFGGSRICGFAGFLEESEEVVVI